MKGLAALTYFRIPIGGFVEESKALERDYGTRVQRQFVITFLTYKGVEIHVHAYIALLPTK